MKLIILISILYSFSLKADFIKSVKAKLYSAPKMGTTVQCELNQGQEVNIESKDKNWVKVTHPKCQGWLANLLLSKEKVTSKESALSTAEDISKNARSRASAITSAGAARGLLQDNSAMLSSLEGVDYTELKKLESFYVDPTSSDRLLIKR